MDYYIQFSRNDTSKIEALRKDGREGRQQTAVILRRLLIVAKEVDIAAADKDKVGVDSSIMN